MKKLIFAHRNYNDIFVSGGLFHFKTGGRATSVRDSLKKEGFSVGRINDECIIQ